MNATEDNSNNDNKNSDTRDVKKSDNITLSKPTFYKIVIVGVIALMVSAFFAGYNLHSFINPVTYVTAPPTLPAGQIPSAGSPTASPESLPPPTPVSIENLTLGDSPVLGKAEAEIALVEFSDFQCPFCESFFSNALSEIKKEYVDTGKIKFIYKHLPLDFHPNAKPAALASECANAQGKFWEYHDTLFSNQTVWQNLSGNQTSDEFLKYAQNLGLNEANFKSCIDNKEYEDKINRDVLQASTIGATGTPTLFVGNDEKNFTSIEGAQPFASFKLVIDQKLSS